MNLLIHGSGALSRMRSVSLILILTDIADGAVSSLSRWLRTCRSHRELGSASAVADSKQTLRFTYLSTVLLVGLVLNSLFGWSQIRLRRWRSPSSLRRNASGGGLSVEYVEG